MGEHTWRGMRQPGSSVFGVVTVIACDRVSEGFHRIRFRDAVGRAFTSDHVAAEAIKLALPPQPQPTALPFPTEPGTRLGPWAEKFGAVPRVYTLRDVDPEAGEFDLDFFLHPGGYASEWALAAQPGWTVFATGKRYQYQPPAGTERFLLLGDETAVPAIGEILAAIPGGVPVHAVIEIGSNADVRTLAQNSGQSIEWILRNERTLVDALGELEVVAGTKVWAACESGQLSGLRKLLRVTKGISRGDVDLTGYWRRGVDLTTSQSETADAAARLAAAGIDIGNQYNFESFEPEVDLAVTGPTQ